jgi:hypothetical protein
LICQKMLGLIFSNNAIKTFEIQVSNALFSKHLLLRHENMSHP